MQTDQIKSRLARHIALILAAASLTACGSESTAASNEERGNSAMSAAASAQSNPAPQASSAATALPIAQGMYVSENIPGGCAAATAILFYDGTNIGDVRTNEEWEGNDGPSSSVERIVRIGPPRRTPDADFAAASRGFTLAWSADQDGGDFPSLAVKPAGQGRFARLVTSGGNGIMGGFVEYIDETYQQCAFAQLSPQMQTAIRAERPRLVGGAAAVSSSAVSAQSSSDALPSSGTL